MYCSSFMWVFPEREKQSQINELLPGQRLSRMICCCFTIDLASVFHHCQPHISIWLSPLTQCNPDIIVRIIYQSHIWQHVRNGGLFLLWQFLACLDIFVLLWCNGVSRCLKEGKSCCHCHGINTEEIKLPASSAHRIFRLNEPLLNSRCKPFISRWFFHWLILHFPSPCELCVT